MARNTTLALACIVVPLSIAAETQATSFDTLPSVEELSREADLVVVAEVLSQRVVPAGESPSGSLETHSELNILEYLRGSGASTLRLRQLGGATAHGSEAIVDDGHPQVGRRVLLFLRQTQEGPFADFVHLLLLGFGAYDLTEAGPVVVAKPHAEAPQQYDTGRPLHSPQTLPVGQEVSLEELRHRIHSAVDYEVSP